MSSAVLFRHRTSYRNLSYSCCLRDSTRRVLLPSSPSMSNVGILMMRSATMSPYPRSMAREESGGFRQVSPRVPSVLIGASVISKNVVHLFSVFGCVFKYSHPQQLRRRNMTERKKSAREYLIVFSHATSLLNCPYHSDGFGVGTHICSVLGLVARTSI
jgi:hypothetical protein